MSIKAKPYLQKITLLRETISEPEAYPFNLPIIKNLKEITFHPDVTFFIGENGSGKSTLIEAIAVLMRFNPEGGNKNSLFSTSETHSNLYKHLRPSKSFKRPKDGYFLRAESFYNVATYVDEVGYLDGYGGNSLHRQSHGESFTALLSKKIRGNGIYIMDEPEAALSPAAQLQTLARIHQLVKLESQFIIATHSPILLAYPNAQIYQIHEGVLQTVNYQDTEHYSITRNFLNRPEEMLKILMEDEMDVD